MINLSYLLGLRGINLRIYSSCKYNVNETTEDCMCIMEINYQWCETLLKFYTLKTQFWSYFLILIFIEISVYLDAQLHSYNDNFLPLLPGCQKKKVLFFRHNTEMLLTDILNWARSWYVEHNTWSIRKVNR